jgi:hypothetical protein
MTPGRALLAWILGSLALAGIWAALCELAAAVNRRRDAAWDREMRRVLPELYLDGDR